MRKFVLAISITAVMNISVFAQKSNIRGTWQLTQILINGGSPMVMKVTQPSVYMFTAKYYSKTYVSSDRPRPVLDDYRKASQEDLVRILVDGFEASAGTYEITKGPANTTLLKLHPVVAKSPTDMKEGTWVSYWMKIDGNTITLTPDNSNIGPNKKSVTFKLTRIE